MKKKYLPLLVFALLPLTSVVNAAAIPSSLTNQMPTEIEINNRILAKINGKVISVLDVTKKMDLIFYRQYPELTSSTVARYQFYLNNWTSVLINMLDDELVIADAVEKEVEITDGDVREEMETLFGPHVVLNIDKAGLTYEEAWTLLKNELIVRRMNMYMVRSKAIQQVHPRKLRELYDEFARQNQKEDLWRYRVLAIRSENEEKCNRVAEIAYKLLDEEKIPFEKIAETLAAQGHTDEEVNIALSEEYERNEKELALAHKAILQTLSIGQSSSPIMQTTKKGSDLVNRIFYLNEKIAGQVASFHDMEEKLRKEVLQKAIAKESENYLKKLRRHYGINDKYLKTMIPDQFVPYIFR